MEIGDLVKLKGFNIAESNEVPHGLISADFGLNKFKVKWLDENIATRWALGSIIAGESLEVVNSAS
tara:strand:+ start:495 stop:692 length:198 start_codon:yes stop_codon:yes gene_type:complete